MPESKEATDAYQGYAEKEVIGRQKNLAEHIFYTSDFAHRFHFDKQSKQGKIVVDFGGRIGERTRKIENVTVVEIDASARKWMAENGVKCTGSIENFADASVDTIYCSHVLEHLENPMDYLRTFYRKLGKKGKLILVLPAETQTIEPRAAKIDENGHLQTWNYVHIATSLNRAGFKNIGCRYIVFPSMRFMGRIDRNLYDTASEIAWRISRHRQIRNAIFMANGMLRLLGNYVKKMDIQLQYVITAEKN
jgi:ubiquinone/menaquinone biosynthesis C-methylase UbiE